MMPVIREGTRGAEEREMLSRIASCGKSNGCFGAVL